MNREQRANVFAIAVFVGMCVVAILCDRFGWL